MGVAQHRRRGFGIAYEERPSLHGCRTASTTRFWYCLRRATFFTWVSHSIDDEVLVLLTKSDLLYMGLPQHRRRGFGIAYEERPSLHGSTTASTTRFWYCLRRATFFTWVY